MSVRADHDIALGVKVRDGDTLIGESNKSGRLPWTSPVKRASAVWAEFEIDGEPAVTNPALICVEALQRMPSPKKSTPEARRESSIRV